MYVSVQSCYKSETIFAYHHTSSLLCGKILTTPTFLLLKYEFIADARLEAKNAKVGNLNRNCFQRYHVFPLRGVKDWVHMKTAKMMHDFNWLCNLDVNHKLLLIFIIKVVYLCTLHNKIISPAHFVVYVLWRPTPTWYSNINA